MIFRMCSAIFLFAKCMYLQKDIEKDEVLIPEQSKAQIKRETLAYIETYNVM